jgi:hypothetical protein
MKDDIVIVTEDGGQATKSTLRTLLRRFSVVRRLLSSANKEGWRCYALR